MQRIPFIDAVTPALLCLDVPVGRFAAGQRSARILASGLVLMQHEAWCCFHVPACKALWDWRAGEGDVCSRPWGTATSGTTTSATWIDRPDMAVLQAAGSWVIDSGRPA